MDDVPRKTHRGGNIPGLVGEARVAELERHRRAGLLRLVEHLAPLTERMIEDWAPRMVQARAS